MVKKTNNKKHVPMRTCIVTRKKFPKNDLIRLVHTPDDKVIIDRRGKAKGRGANISQDALLFNAAIEKGILKRALRLERPLTKEEILSLKQEFKEAIEEKSFRPDNKPVKIRVGKKDLEKLS